MSDIPVFFGDIDVARHRHICTLFRDPDEKYRALLPFIREGLQHGDKVVMMVDPRLRDRHLTHLYTAMIDVLAVLRTGQLEVRGWNEGYLHNGRFEKERMLSLVREVLIDCARHYPSVRVIGNMEWIFEDGAGSLRDLLEYECRINDIVPNFRVSGVCTYDADRFSPSEIIDILRTHPAVVFDHTVQVNPFFIPPGEFLRSLNTTESCDHR
jgi:hypothetical protein